MDPFNSQEQDSFLNFLYSGTCMSPLPDQGAQRLGGGEGGGDSSQVKITRICHIRHDILQPGRNY